MVALALKMFSFASQIQHRYPDLHLIVSFLSLIRCEIFFMGCPHYSLSHAKQSRSLKRQRNVHFLLEMLESLFEFIQPNMLKSNRIFFNQLHKEHDENHERIDENNVHDFLCCCCCYCWFSAAQFPNCFWWIGLDRK